MAQNFGANPELNQRMAAATGYTGDFANGGFQAFLAANPNLQSAAATVQSNYNDPAQNFGINQNTNRQLAAKTGYTGDFGGGEYQAWVAQQAPETLGTSRAIEQLYTDPSSVFAGLQNYAGVPTSEQWYGFDQLGYGLTNLGQGLALGLGNLGQGITNSAGSMPTSLTLETSGNPMYNPVYGGSGYNYGGNNWSNVGLGNSALNPIWGSGGMMNNFSGNTSGNTNFSSVTYGQGTY